MRDIILISDTPLTVEEYDPHLTEAVPHCEKNGDSGFCIEKPYGLFLDFSKDKISDLPDGTLTPEQTTAISSFFQTEELYITDINYHRSIDVKRVISVLLSKHSRLFLIVEDEREWYGTAEDYMKTDFEY
ncbi:MAG: hypothetical protein IKX49_04665 [Clostridia bacterium]|nr:hypothetical protein [Clostridia bacterium]